MLNLWIGPCKQMWPLNGSMFCLGLGLETFFFKDILLTFHTIVYLPFHCASLPLEIFVHIFRIWSNTSIFPQYCLGKEGEVRSYTHEWYFNLPFLFLTYAFQSYHISFSPICLVVNRANLYDLGKTNKKPPQKNKQTRWWRKYKWICRIVL